MQTCMLAIGIILAGQIGDASGTRYAELPPAAPANGGIVETAQPPATQLPVTQLPATQPRVTQQSMTQPPARVPPAATSPSRLTKVTRSAELLRSLTKVVGREKLTGVPLSLAEAVQNARSRAEQTSRVSRYWELSQAMTDFQLASLAELELQSLRNGLGQSGQAWGLAQQAVTARKLVARSAVQVAQLRLQKELGRTGDNTVSLPSDLPHCGAYETKYEQIFRGRTSREAEQLGELLTLCHKQLGQLAAGATAAREWLILVRGQQSPQNDSAPLLKAYEQLTLQRQAFVALAYQYNVSIARYTELAVPQEIGNGRLVAMLIQSEGNTAGNWQRGAIQRATAEEAVPQQRVPSQDAGRYQPRTFAEPGRSETRRVPAGEEKGERSILVAPSR